MLFPFQLKSTKRGMTMAPRINVYSDIACRAVGAPTPTSSLLTYIFADECKSPAVQARASKIQASVLTIMNVLSSASTGLWSQWGDHRGRKNVFCVSIVCLVTRELVFLFVSGSATGREEAFILVGPVMEGLAGGLSVFNGVFHAYISDCTPDGSRAKIFSAVQGTVFVGLAIGPWIAGGLTSYTDLTPYSMFYISIAIQLVLLFYTVFIFPESIRAKHQHSSRPAVGLAAASDASPSTLKEFARRFTAGFVSPITIFRPRIVERGTSLTKDYNVTFMGLAMFLYITSTAINQLKYLYGKNAYSWTSEQLGYYMSLLWISRAINLFVVLPLIVSYFKPKTPITGVSTPESIVLELQFDKRLAQGSLFVDALANVLVALSSSEVAFFAFSAMSAFTSGGNPALQSLGAVCLAALGYSSEAGRLFGAVGVLNAVSHSISPAIYAVTYSMTVSTHPRTVFCVAAGLLLTAVALLGRIRAKGMSSGY
ncbi:major facilitator superfamily domain-containing protein [Mycena pura]|uniref:Major facilitator superfamily domain-containing protein n=1 Tax=Mycena pura TaxID=153505 RepID=A0AAD6YRP5_9AGAR|nr:major facilitator superfamily domain-containing protein [Mycena pura]